MRASETDPPAKANSDERVALREEYWRTGRIRDAWPLADPSVLTALREDAGLFDDALATLRREGRRRVPYLLTPAIERVARDRNLLDAVGALLGEHAPWVMWGPNIQREVPNNAGRWHVDIESWHWPSLTVVLGLRGCTPASATRCIPHSHRLARQPPAGRESVEVLRTARACDPRCDRIERFEGFGDGRFYLFDARCWHCGEDGTSRERLALFLHFQRASDPRIPYMKDFRHGTWFDAPAPFIAVGGAPDTANVVSTRLYARPLRKLNGYLAPLRWQRKPR